MKKRKKKCQPMCAVCTIPGNRQNKKKAKKKEKKR